MNARPQGQMEAIRAVFEELSFPSRGRLATALKARGIPYTTQQVEELTKGEETKQVLALGPQYAGHIASPGLNRKWQADILDYTTRPSEPGGKSTFWWRRTSSADASSQSPWR